MTMMMTTTTKMTDDDNDNDDKIDDEIDDDDDGSNNNETIDNGHMPSILRLLLHILVIQRALVSNQRLHLHQHVAAGA